MSSSDQANLIDTKLKSKEIILFGDFHFQPNLIARNMRRVMAQQQPCLIKAEDNASPFE